ncbi:helix-turn-helix domain-containing protein [Nocardia sp. NPDC004654]|uniref:TetR/AcrR family transcriptional regulator n=1 Tax=Nocardia sp. NPDC004654 TaxID=3154776 RepID=UPI0033B13534
MRRPAWNGSPPRDHREARTRILDATMRSIDTRGAQRTNLTNIAEALGVTRQTVYRHFASTEELFTAVGFAALDHYVNRLLDHLVGVGDPAEFVIEAIAYTIERFPKDRYLTVLLTAGMPTAFSRRAMTEQSLDACRTVLTRSDIDWQRIGYGDEQLTELSEFVVRLMLSFIADPRPTVRGSTELRGFLRRWVAPAIREPSSQRTAALG